MKKAVLVIHGFAGSYSDEEELINYLELDRKLDVFAFTLPGHGGINKKSKYEDWISSSEEHLNYLIKNGYRKIYVIGHSMGGVIASYLASKYKQVKKLVLVAPAFDYLKVEDDKINFVESIKLFPKINKDYGLDEVLSRFRKLPISATKEFMDLVSKYRGSVKNIKIPVLFIQGLDDSVVPISSSKYAYKNLNNIKLIYVKGVTHDAFRSDRREELSIYVKKFLKRHNKKGKEIIEI